MIGNTNTGRLHHEDCSAVKMIALHHIVLDASSEQFPVYCHWCGGRTVIGRQSRLEEYYK